MKTLIGNFQTNGNQIKLFERQEYVKILYNNFEYIRRHFALEVNGKMIHEYDDQQEAWKDYKYVCARLSKETSN